MRALFLAAEFFQSNTSTFSVCCKVRFKNMYILLCENSSWSIWVACCIWEHLTAGSFLPPEIILLGAWVCFCSLSCLFLLEMEVFLLRHHKLPHIKQSSSLPEEEIRGTREVFLLCCFRAPVVVIFVLLEIPWDLMKYHPHLPGCSLVGLSLHPVVA